MDSVYLRRLRSSRWHPRGILLLAFAACTPSPSRSREAVKSFAASNLLNHIKTLSSDEYEGRAPGSKGEQLSLKYIEDQFRALNLEPGNPDGTFLQKVPLAGITPDPAMKLTFTKGGKKLEMKFQQDFVAWTKRVTPSVDLDADTIFVGYGAQAPEYKWDDFKGVDVKGKMLVVLVNDPPVEDENIFGGKAMTYYGRWTYKYEKAAELGAAGCLIVHETGPAGYPWAVVAQKSGEQFDLVTPDKNTGRAAVEGWITREQAEKLFKMAGKDFEALKKAGIVPGNTKRAKIILAGKVEKAFKISGLGTSKGAKAAIEKAGGSVAALEVVPAPDKLAAKPKGKAEARPAAK